MVSGAGVPDPPKQPQCVARSAHSATVTWEGPVNNGATITDYRLEWQQKAEQDFQLVGDTGSFLRIILAILTAAHIYQLVKIHVNVHNYNVQI